MKKKNTVSVPEKNTPKTAGKKPRSSNAATPAAKRSPKKKAIPFNAEAVLNGISDGFFHLDAHWRFSYANPLVSKFFGEQARRLIGKVIWEQFPQLAQEQRPIFSECRAAVADQQVKTFNDFSEPLQRWFDFRAYPVPDGLAVHFQDATEKIALENQFLLQSRALNATAEGIIITDARQKNNPIVFVNDAVLMMTGYDEKDFLGKNCRFLQNGDRDQPELEKVRTAIRTGTPCVARLRNYRKDGSFFWNELSLSPIFDAKGELTHFIGVQNDVTAKVEAEAALRQGQAYFETVFNESTDAKFLVNPETNLIVDCNRRAVELLEVNDKNELIGTFGGRFQEREFTTEEVDAIWMNLNSNGAWNGDLPYVSAKGKRFWGNLAISKLEIAGKPMLLVRLTDISDAKRIEQKLRDSEERYRVISELTSDYVYSARVEGDQIITEWASEKLQDISGYTAEEINRIGGWQNVIYPDDVPRVMEQVQALFAGREYVNEYRIVAKSGNVKWVRDISRPIQDEHGKTVRIYGGTEDITAKKEAQAQLEASEKFLRSLLDALPIAICLYHNKLIEFANIAFLRSRGLETFSIEDLRKIKRVNRSPEFELIHPDDEKQFVENLDEHRAVIEQGGVVTVDRRIRKYGESTYRWYSCSIFKSTLGEKEYVIEIDNDITERKAAEEATRQSEALLAETEKTAHIGSWEWNIETGKIKWSAETFKIYERPEELGEPSVEEVFQRYVSAEKANRMKGVIERALNGEAYDVIEKIITEHGSEKWVRAIGKPVMHHGRVVKLVGSIMDISELKAAEREKDNLYAQLLQAQKLDSLGTLTSGVAHEFNNILAGIMGNASLMRGKVEPNSKLALHVQRIEENSRRAATLIRQMLGFARKGKSNVQPVQLQDCVRNVIEIFSPTLDRKIQIIYDATHRPPMIEGDKGQLEQVILNLAVNARDAIMETLPHKGYGEIHFTVDVSTIPSDDAKALQLKADAPFVHLAVRDTGIGMTEEIQQKIFEPFFTTKEVGKGTGLGLSMVYGIVKGHNGYIFVDSQLGKGTTFHLYFQPTVAKTAKHDKVKPVLTMKGTGRVLVIDDELSVREMVSETLSDAGFEVTMAENGAKGVEAFRHLGNDVKLVIVDMNMPVMNGLETFQQLKRLNPTVRVILCTGYASNYSVSNLLRDSLQGVLEKPFTAEQLLETVAKYIPS